MSKLKIGFIIDEDQVSSDALRLINLILDKYTFFEAPILVSQIYQIKDEGLILKIGKQFKHLPQRVLSKIIMRLEGYLLKKNKLFSNYNQKILVSSLGLKVIKIHPRVESNGHTHTFSDEDLENIDKYNLDVLIRSGTGILKGRILNIAKFGVLSFHHADNREIRGMPVGFWEVFLKKPSTGFIIQQLTEQLDNGNVLARGNIPTASYWQLNAARIYQKANIFLFNLLKEIALSGELPSKEAPLEIRAKLFKPPSFTELAWYCNSQSIIFLKNILTRFVGYKHVWSVSFVPFSGLKLNLSEGITIQNPKGRFLADPFVISGENGDYCFVEDFSYSENKGKISCFRISHNGYKYMGTALEEKFHLSFPYIFQFEGKLYMCPETAQINEVRLYENISFPNKWVYKQTILKNISASDTVIFKQKNYWYLLTSICSSDMDDRLSELHLYSSDNPLSSNWERCSFNPVIFDSQKARNGGFFKLGDTLYRINQLHEKGRYGTSIEINQINTVERHQYSERSIFSVEPTFFKNLTGIHHLHMNNNFCVYDHSRFKKIN